ncbi:phage terminase small subunit P27 family [Lampropedia aestuarii]|uniref:Phage terminase small subunit P27 family n=1 Tax=Lampropedia aestuarii TaxID=2562762 RepID=A0A4S5BJX4_9BURK|nr:phage terminase small subunit P27 family [Lampropedia aestuarii]THJ30951.1 phage terminase small subunit P27 family [Lampropedia aestuarii]
MAGVSGRSGRRPKPTAKKLLAGNPGKRAINQDEPDFGLVQSIDCPFWMGDHGRELWETVCPLLCREKVLEATDVQNLEVYCNAYDQFRIAQEEVKNNGVTVLGASGSPIKNPAVTAVKEAVAMMATYGGMLGLDPASRQRIIGKKPEGGGNPFAELFNA